MLTGFFKKNLYVFLLLIFSIPLFFIGVTDVHAWGDDYAQYIKEAENIATGKPYYESNYVFNNYNVEYAPPEYPPGFPLLIAPIVKIWGISIRPLLYFISFCVASLLFVLFFRFKKHMSELTALCLALVGAYSGSIIDLKWHVLSDIPVVLFSTLYFYIRASNNLSKQKISLLVIVSTMAVLIRTQSIILLLAEAIYLLFSSVIAIKKKVFSFNSILKSGSFQILIGFSVLYFLLITTVFKSPNSSVGFYANLFAPYKQNAWGIISTNAAYLVELLGSMLHYFSFNPLLQILITLIGYSCLAISAIGLVRLLRKNISVEIIFFILMCCLIIASPLHQGIRYLLPVLPFYLLLIYSGASFVISNIFKSKAKWIAVFFTAVYLCLGIENYTVIPYQADWNPYNKEDVEAFDYLREHIKNDDIIVFSKPRALALYTNKKCMNISWQVNSQKNKEKFDEVKVKYMLTKNGVDDIMVLNYLKEMPCAIDTTKINDLYTLFTIR